MNMAKTCVDANINHIKKNEIIVFQLTKSKGHQNGENHVGPWHMYANPHEPHLCDNLELSRYICTYPQLLVEGIPLFE